MWSMQPVLTGVLCAREKCVHTVSWERTGSYSPQDNFVSNGRSAAIVVSVVECDWERELASDDCLERQCYAVHQM